ncbi:alpha/beta fold hydrolase [Candidatus Gottesmanbacteria bacterium]|nr:alpha/beta fold hydrolase [Candidatus Gottesmanbacteria bacterium]
MINFSIVFIHGYTASSLSDWYPAIAKELKKLHVDFAIPDLPGRQSPKASQWLRVLHSVINNTKKPLIIVGHSLGTRAALLYLEKYKKRVEKVFLIAAFANAVENTQRHNGEAYPDFFTHRIDMKKIKQLGGKFIVIHSKDDSSIPFSQGVSIAKDLSAELITYNGKDHFSAPEDAVIILDVLRRELRI